MAIVVFLGLALLTYDPADSLDALEYPPPVRATNACGRAGALMADLLLHGLGIGAYYAVLSLAVVDAWLLGRRQVTQAWLRGIGWVLSLIGMTTLASLTIQAWSPGPIIGPGGYLGAAGRGFLEMHFASAGAYILTISVLAGGLLLCTEYLLPRLIGRVFGAPVGTLKAARSRLAKAGESNAVKRPRTDLDQAELGDEEAAPAIKISGRKTQERKQEVIDEPDAEEVDEVEVDEDGDEEEAAAPATVPAAPVAPGPRLTRPKKQSERDEVMTQLDAASRTDEPQDYELPSIDLLLQGEEISFDEHEKEVRRKAKILEKTFLDFGFNVNVVEIETGPVIAQFEVELEAGLRLSQDHRPGRRPGHRPARAQRAHRGADPGQEHRRHRSAQRRAADRPPARGDRRGQRQGARRCGSRSYLGKDVAGKPMVVDLATLPHLLIAGRTGTGKSVCLNSIIVSMLMTRRPDEVRMLMIDPKMVELSPYKTLPHLMHPVVTDMRKAEAILAWAVEKMEERYALLGPGRRAAHRRLQPVGRRRADGAAAARGRRRTPGTSPRTCRTS